MAGQRSKADLGPSALLTQFRLPLRRFPGAFRPLLPAQECYDTPTSRLTCSYQRTASSASRRPSSEKPSKTRAGQAALQAGSGGCGRRCVCLYSHLQPALTRWRLQDAHELYRRVLGFSQPEAGAREMERFKPTV